MWFRGFAAVVALLLTTGTAQAYIDPGAGSFILQMILAGALAVGATVRLFWYRIKDVLRRILPGRQNVGDKPR